MYVYVLYLSFCFITKIPFHGIVFIIYFSSFLDTIINSLDFQFKALCSTNKNGD